MQHVCLVIVILILKVNESIYLQWGENFQFCITKGIVFKVNLIKQYILFCFVLSTLLEFLLHTYIYKIK